jgi:hypothetical protein
MLDARAFKVVESEIRHDLLVVPYSIRLMKFSRPRSKSIFDPCFAGIVKTA